MLFFCASYTLNYRFVFTVGGGSSRFSEGSFFNSTGRSVNETLFFADSRSSLDGSLRNIFAVEGRGGARTLTRVDRRGTYDDFGLTLICIEGS